ncbi:hypothetical protein I4U23_001446 [Adineta vaga]|nr:hypothetical protein I4U23_001446 [Adineta vaga]
MLRVIRDQLHETQSNAVKARHRSRKTLHQHESVTKTSSKSIIHVTIRRRKSIQSTQKKSLSNSRQDSKDQTDSLDIYKRLSHPHSFKINQVEPVKPIRSSDHSMILNTKKMHDRLENHSTLRGNNVQVDDGVSSLNTANTLNSSLSSNDNCSKTYLRNSVNDFNDIRNLTVITPDKWCVTNDFHRQNSKNRAQRKYLSKNCCHCSWRCIVISVLSVLCLSIAISTLLVGLLIKPYKSISTISYQNTTTTTGVLQTLSSLIEGSLVYMNCSSPTPTINIHYAFYGVQNLMLCNCASSPCSKMDVTVNVTSYCGNNASICTFISNNAFFLDTCFESEYTTNEQYCLIRWSDRKNFDIVPLNQIKASPTSIQVYETYTVNYNGRECKGTILLKGTRHDCERLYGNISPTQSTNSSAVSTNEYSKDDNTLISKTSHSDSAIRTKSNILSDVQEETKGSSRDEKEEKAIRNAVLMQILQLMLGNNTSTENDNGEFHRVQCTACGCSPIRTDRYKCLHCEKINLCARCFERRRESNHHKSGHAFVHFKTPGEIFGRTVTDADITLSKLQEFHKNDVHDSISCDGCDIVPIIGLRFKCDTCPNYNLCQRCLARDIISKKHESTHPLIVISREPVHRIPASDIELGDELGKGAFGAVYKAKWLSKKRPVACKLILVPPTVNAEILEKSFLKEIAAYTELSGAYILKTYGFSAGIHEKGKVYMLIMEYMSRGSLASLIKDKGNQISLRRKLDMARHIVSGMRKIHEHRMIHRDIRPDNILVNEYYIAKIGDMGIARVIDPMNQHTMIGCQPYMPPEFYRGSYDQKLDIFTFGLTLNELFTSKRHVFQPRADNKIAFSEPSPIFADLIARCTVDDPKRRPTALEIEKTLDLYNTGFNEMILKKHPGYITLSTEDKDKIFVAFYEKFHLPATEFIRKRFPSEFLENPQDVPGVKVDTNAANPIQIQCPVQ